MADKAIRKEFVEGVQEIFTTLFNDGSEETDGVFLYLLSETQTPRNVYGENKYKVYQKPKLLVCKAVIHPTHGDQDVEEVKDSATFTVTYKSLTDNGLEVTQESLSSMRRGVVKFHDVFYKVDLISPKAYVEDVFLMYDFQCTEDPDVTEDDLLIEEDEETPTEDEDQEDPPEEDQDTDTPEEGEESA